MGDRFQIVAFRNLANPTAVGQAVLKALREADLIGAAEQGWPFGPTEGIWRPGQGANANCKSFDHIMGLQTNHVVLKPPRYFNGWALMSEWAQCPACDATLPFADHEAFSEELGPSGYEWSQTPASDPSSFTVACPSCAVHSPVQDWRLEDPVFCADLAFEFWNWQFFDYGTESSWWRLDVPGLMARAAGQDCVTSYVKI